MLLKGLGMKASTHVASFTIILWWLLFSYWQIGKTVMLVILRAFYMFCMEENSVACVPHYKTILTSWLHIKPYISWVFLFSECKHLWFDWLITFLEFMLLIIIIFSFFFLNKSHNNYSKFICCDPFKGKVTGARILLMRGFWHLVDGFCFNF